MKLYGSKGRTIDVEFCLDTRLVAYGRALDPGRRRFAPSGPSGFRTDGPRPWGRCRETGINDADEALAKSSYDSLSPEPYQPHCDKLDLERFYATQIPKSYLNGTEDNALPQGAEWGWHPRMSNRRGLFRLVQMPGSHEVIFTNPGGLAAKLFEAGRD